MDEDQFIVCGKDCRETHETKKSALESFQQVVAIGGWCEVWHQTAPNSGMKIADFPGYRFMKKFWNTFVSSEEMVGIMHNLRCVFGVFHNIKLLRQEKALLDQMQRDNPGQNVYYLPPQ